jgi:hypothetical protein
MTSMAKWWLHFSDLKRTRGKIPRLSYRPRIEALEERAVPSTDTWTGLGGNPNWSNPANWDNGVPNPGDDLQFISTFSNPPPAVNDLPLWTTFHAINFVAGQPIIDGYINIDGVNIPQYEYPQGLPTLTGNAIILTGGITSGPAQLNNATIAFNGLALGASQSFSGYVNIRSPFNLNGFALTGGLFWGPFLAKGAIASANIQGPVTLTGPFAFDNIVGTANVNVNGFDMTVDGVGSSISNISGAGSITINGSLSVGDHNTVNDFTGMITVNQGGDLIIEGTNVGSVNVNGGTFHLSSGTNLGPVIVNNNGTLLSDNAIISDHSSVAGPVTITQGTLVLQVGNGYTTPAIFKPDSLTLIPGATFQVEVGGTTPGSDYAQMQANGPVDLGGATLSLQQNQYHSIPSSVGYVIVESNDSITGTFNGLPEGASVTVNNQTFQIHYFNAGGGFPARVVLVNDPRVTYTKLISVPNPFPQTPLLTATVADIGAGPVNGVAVPAQGTVTFLEGRIVNVDGTLMTSALGPPVPLVNGASFTPLLQNVPFENTSNGNNMAFNYHFLTAVFNPADSTSLTSSSSNAGGIMNPIDMGWRDVMTGDFNGDGKADIVGRSSAGQWFVGVSDGSSSFTNQLWTTWNEAAGWQDVQVGDFNGDGKADIAGRTAWGDWWVALSDGSSFTNSFWGHWNPNVTWVDVKVGDFNGDGKADIVGRWLEAGQWWMAQSTGSSFTNSLWGTWNPAATFVDVQAADFDGDKKTDLTARWLQGGSWWTAISTGSSFVTSMWASWNPAATWVDVKAGDFNGDGKADLTGRWLEGGQWWTAISTGSSFTTTLWASWNPNVTWVDVQVGDFNGDGKADITGRWLQGGSWWTATSTGSSFTTNSWASWNPNVTWVDSLTADFTGDGKADLTSRYQQGGQWWSATSSGSDFATSLWTTWPV